ncbi:MAG: class I SAM-dependent methyltransferase [Alphaproteobacteria bacterium]
MQYLPAINNILFWVLATLLIIDAYFVIFHGGIPNIRTAPAIRKKIIELLKEDFEAKKKSNYTIVDVGSGNGLFTREIARALPDAKVVGIELARQSVFWSNCLKRIMGLTNLEYRRMNFLSFHFGEADAVTMYLLPSVMVLLGKKLNEEARPDTLITSNKFPLGDGWEPQQVLDVNTLYIHQKKLFIYRKKL